MKPTFLRTLKITIVANLGNLFYVAKDKIEMLPKTSKRTIKDKHVFCARPMVSESNGFAFESMIFTEQTICEELAEQDLYLQFWDSATDWVTGFTPIDETHAKKHPKLDRACRITITNPALYKVQKTDTDGTKYTHHFLRVSHANQIEPYRNLYSQVNLVELANLAEVV
jgi:hypothetical protein